MKTRFELDLPCPYLQSTLHFTRGLVVKRQWRSCSSASEVYNLEVNLKLASKSFVHCSSW